MEHGLELFFGDFLDGAVDAIAGVVNEDINVTESGRGEARYGLDLGGPGDVEDEDASGIGVESRQVVKLGGVAGRCKDAFAAAEQFAGEQSAEAGGTAGDEPDAGSGGGGHEDSLLFGLPDQDAATNQ